MRVLLVALVGVHVSGCLPVPVPVPWGDDDDDDDHDHHHMVEPERRVDRDLRMTILA